MIEFRNISKFLFLCILSTFLNANENLVNEKYKVAINSSDKVARACKSDNAVIIYKSLISIHKWTNPSKYSKIYVLLNDVIKNKCLYKNSDFVITYKTLSNLIILNKKDFILIKSLKKSSNDSVVLVYEKPNNAEYGEIYFQKENNIWIIKKHQRIESSRWSRNRLKELGFKKTKKKETLEIKCKKNKIASRCYEKGYNYIQIKNFKLAHEYFLLGALLKDYNSMFSLGIMNRYGDGIEKNLSKTYAWYSLSGIYIDELKMPRSKVKMHKDAAYYISLIMSKEEIVKGKLLLVKYKKQILNYNKKKYNKDGITIKSLLQGCDYGYINECHSAGMYYYKIKDYDNSYIYLEKASKKAYYNSLFIIAYIYEYEIGRSLDLVKALAFYTLAYEQIMEFDKKLLENNRFSFDKTRRKAFYEDMHLDDDIPPSIGVWSSPKEKMEVFKNSIRNIKSKMTKIMILESKEIISKFKIKKK